ncbi:DNA translocase FtsK [Niallia taxi]|uniref:DNA translocase FtsK n=1 Tax=Niallia taxi TaxID=2499688 RepID=UPI00254D1B6A|nr:DNA translocase FtsK [Niallia taxi]MDK8639342.1 DNA translocase FtsK [Niallia taxi]
MSWFKKVIKQFIKEDHEEMEPFEAAEKQEDPLIRNDWNNEWKKEEDSKIIYKYPKGKFRFPVISDEEIGIPGRQSRQDHQAERWQNAQATERQEPAQAGRQSGQGYTEQQVHTVEKRQNAATFTGRQEQSLNSKQPAPTNTGRQERPNERRQNVSVNKGMQEVPSDRRNRQEISNNRRTSSQAIHSRLKPRELPEESTPNPKSYQSKMPFKPTEIPSPIYGYNNRPKVEEKPKVEVERTKIDSSDFLTSVMRRKEAAEQAEQAALRAELQKEESKASNSSEKSGAAEIKLEPNISNARDIEQTPKEIAINTEASQLNKATVQNSIPAVHSSEEELQPAFIMEETEELNSLIQNEPIASLIVEEIKQPKEAEEVMNAASKVVYELEEEPLLQEEERTTAKVDVILPQEEKLYVEPAEVVELEEEPLLQEEERTTAKVDVILPQEEKLYVEPAEVVELEEEPLLQEEEQTAAKVDVILPQKEKLYIEPAEAVELEEEPLLQEEEQTTAKVDVILPQEEKLYIEPAELVALEEEPFLQEEEQTTAKVDVILPQEEKQYNEAAEAVELEEHYSTKAESSLQFEELPLIDESAVMLKLEETANSIDEKVDFAGNENIQMEVEQSSHSEVSSEWTEEQPSIEKTEVTAMVTSVVKQEQKDVEEIKEPQNAPVKKRALPFNVLMLNTDRKSLETKRKEQQIKKQEQAVQSITESAAASEAVYRVQEEQVAVSEPVVQVQKEQAVVTEPVVRVQEEQAVVTEPVVRVQEEQAAVTEPVVRVQEEQAAASEPVVQVQKEQAVVTEPVVRVQEEQAVVTEPVVRVQEEQAVMSEPVVRVQEEQAVMSEPVVRVQEEQAVMSEPVVRVQEEQAVMSEPVVRVQEEQAAASEPVIRMQEEQAVVSEPVVEELPYYVFPEDELLSPPIYNTEHDGWIEEQTELLNHTFKNFNVHAKVVNVTQGPSVTRYEVQPEPGVKVSKITNLSDDLKLSLAAKDIRIEAPIPGKHTIGIEVPNRTSRPVLLSEILNSEEFKDSASPLTVALGLDISGKPIVTDLRKMPHGLIAGATGSGKSVCINTMLVSLLYKAKPEDLKLLLIDPKMVELAPYNYIPHLASPVITDVKTATAALKWAVEEMERRYELLAHAGVRDITKFNQLAEQNQQYAQKLPYIVIIIDELADLMMMAPADVEEAISRIAQKARACGIHLLIATQRPSVDVITGLIKANVPTRIAFSVSSQIDSRTVIDISGAEKLLGKGDMLFLENGTSKPVRLQGTFVSDEEIDQVVAHVRRERKPDYLFEQEELLKKVQMSEDEDELFYEACEFIIEQGGASTSSLQRNFKIGYNRAARLIDMMEKQGYISEAKGTKPRDVLITEVEFLQLHDTEQH